jgi:hypothetical protein
LELRRIFSRKVITASVSGTIYAIILGLFIPNFFGKDITSVQDYFLMVGMYIPFYIIFSFPVILIYGVTTSIICDKAGKLAAAKVKKEKAELIVSGTLHLLFGSVFLFFGLNLIWFSLGPSILFFITDRVLQRRTKKYRGIQALASLLLPALPPLILLVLSDWI